jgi:cytochrome P450
VSGTDPVVAPACLHAGLADDFTPFDLTDPFPFYARARGEAPIFYSPELDYWVLTRYADIRDVFRDPATFSSENTQAPYRERPPEVQQILDDGGFSITSGLSGRQPPEHTRLRGFIKKAFTPRRIASMEPEIRTLTRTAIASFADRGEADLVSELARDLPALVVFRMLGIPDEDVPNVKAWALSRVYMNFGDLPVDEQAHHAENLVLYWRYCQDLVAARLRSPQDDLPGDLARIYLDGDETITPDEIASLVYGQLTAGHETTSALLANGLKELLGDRDAWEAICADRALIPAAVEELLRLSAPVFTWKRRLTRSAEVGGVTLPAGTNLLLLLGSANHDERMFSEPDRIDLGRDNASRHLSFGLGIHFCLGAPLARLEAKVVLEELTARFPSLRLRENQTFDFAANTTFRGPSHVLVTWEAAAPDDPYRDVWTAALPYMRARKNDVHIPLAYDYAERLLEHHPQADRDVVLLAIMLHDIGWAVVDQEAIYRDGFGPDMAQSAVRIAHEREGARLAADILTELGYPPQTRDRVTEIIDGHDTRTHALSTEDELVKDADALWRFSVAGIGIACDWFSMTPAEYADLVESQIDGRLFTEAARGIARADLAQTRRLLRTDVLAPDTVPR